MLDLFFLRHGETHWNAEGRLQGHLDIALNETGRAQARNAAATLAALNLTFDTIITSDLARASETASIVAEALDLTPQPTTALREIDVGTWSGRLSRDIEAEEPNLIARIKADYWGTRRPRGESMNDVVARYATFHRSLAPGRHLLVTHRGVIRAALRHLAPEGYDPHAPLTLGNASLTHVAIDQTGCARIMASL